MTHPAILRSKTSSTMAREPSLHCPDRGDISHLLAIGYCGAKVALEDILHRRITTLVIDRTGAM